MSSEVFSDSSMLEIFRAEVETHAESLTAGLLAIERDPQDTSHLDEMMRAAHSIKGAARIVGIEPAVRVAHVMEDGFVAAQNGKLTLRPRHVDSLLRGVDMLNRVANSSRDPAVDWRPFVEEVNHLVAEISAVLAGTPAAAPVVATPSSSTASAAQDVTIPLPVMFDASAAETARLALLAAIDAQAPVVHFDLTATCDLDATGLALLAATPEFVGSRGPRMELTGVSAELRAVFQATGIDRLFAAKGC